MTIHTQYLLQALALAQQRRGFCAPNPAVGALIVKDQSILATGYHSAAGQPHAEAEALRQLSIEQTKNATVYVTLEPCCHHGKTPPCTDFIIQNQIKTVYYAFRDPNPLVCGKSAQLLRQAGIDCIHLPLPEIDAFYQNYLYWTETGKPWVSAKLALSLDGKIAGPGGERVAITGEHVNNFVHQWRKQSDAILTTINTVIHDNPQLNVRLPNETYRKPVYVLDTHLRFPTAANLLKTAAPLTIFHQTNVEESKLKWLQTQGVHCVPIPLKYGKLDLDQALTHIGKDGMHHLLLEAGGICFEAFAKANLIQQGFIYVALKWLGANAQTAFADDTDIFTRAKDLKWRALGEDAICEFGFTSNP